MSMIIVVVPPLGRVSEYVLSRPQLCSGSGANVRKPSTTAERGTPRPRAAAAPARALAMLLRERPLRVIGTSTILTSRSGSPLGESTTISPSRTVIPRPPALIDSHSAGEAGSRLKAHGLALI